MSYIRKRITIISISRPREPGLNEELQWFGNSLGLFHLRDKDKSCFRLFIEFLKASRQGQSLSSDELADRTGLSRGTVVHHLNRMMESGLILHSQKKYLLRDPNLENLVQDIKRDFELAFDDLKKAARELDQFLEI